MIKRLSSGSQEEGGKQTWSSLSLEDASSLIIPLLSHSGLHCRDCMLLQIDSEHIQPVSIPKSCGNGILNTDEASQLKKKKNPAVKQSYITYLTDL